MKHPILSICLLFLYFNVTICGNLFFQWRMTEGEKRQLEKETFELVKTNFDLYLKVIENYETRTEEDTEEEPVLQLSRYTHCQKCLTFAKGLKDIINKYKGFNDLLSNLKAVAAGLNIYDKDVIDGMADKYGPIMFGNFYTRYFSDYFFCEKVELCPPEKPINYSNSDNYAKKIIPQEERKSKEKPKKGGETLRMLQITDLHIDPYYKENTTTDCKKPICCRDPPSGEATAELSGKYGYEGKCDVPFELFNEFLEDASKRNIDMIIWTGDNAPHDSWKGEQSAVYEISKQLKEAVVNKFGEDFPVFYSLGNHEKYPNDDYRDNEQDLHDQMTEIFGSIFGNDETAKADFKKGGYYSLKYKDTKLRFIALNCLVCDCFNFNLFNSTKQHAIKMFRWLDNELKKAEENQEYVYILNHFPFNGGFTLTECAKRMQAIFDKYQYTIRGIFSGHTHLDDIEGISEYFNKDKIIMLNYIAPQFTTYSHKLPSYRIYTIDKETMQILDYEQIRFNLTKSNADGKPYWYSAYNATTFYKVDDMTEYDKILNCENMEGYVFNRFSGGKNAEKYKTSKGSQKNAKCTMTTNNFDEYFTCSNPKIGLDTHFLYVFTNFFIGPFENFDE